MVWGEGPAICMDGGGADVWGGSEKGVSVPQTASLAPRFLAEPFSCPGRVFRLSRRTPSSGVDLGHGAGCAQGCLARAGGVEGGWPGCRSTLLTAVFQTHKPTSSSHGNQRKLQGMYWAALLLPGLWQEHPWSFLHPGMQRHQHQSMSAASTDLSASSRTSSTTVSFPSPPPPFHFCRRERKQRGSCTQGVTHRTPGHAGA